MTYGTVQANAIQGSINTFSPNSAVFRNRIINGAMTIDQRNAGASVTLPLGAAYLLDRWYVYSNQASKLSCQQNAGSVTPPAGFKNYLGLTSLSAYSVTAGDEFLLTQRIEGFNTADLDWGTANAKTVTLSFWVRSSLTGTFGGTLKNSDASRNYPYTYSITSANTWEYKTVTIAGDTSGTWVGATNGIGLQVLFGLGVGSTYSGTAGAWTGSNVSSATGATSVVGTNGATFFLTGVQLEVGSTATSFDYRPYGTELQLCQRYYEKSFNIGTAPAEGQTTFATGGCAYANDGLYVPSVQFKVQKRAAPSITLYRAAVNATNGTWGVYDGSSWSSGTSGVVYALEQSFTVNISSNVTADNGYAIAGSWVASAEL